MTKINQAEFKETFKSALTVLLGNRIGAAALRPLWGGRAVIFMLHRLSAGDGINLDSIGHSLNALRRAGATFVSLQQLFQWAEQGREPAPGSVAFTIDDGYADQGVMAERGFIANACPVTIFTISGLVDGRLWPWDDRLAYAIKMTSRSSIRIAGIDGELPLVDAKSRRHAIDALQNLCKEHFWPNAQDVLANVWAETGIVPPESPPPGYEPLSWDEARRLEEVGVAFAPHSVTHRIVSRLSDAEARTEIETSWQRLRAELKRPVPIYAWPTGRFADYSERDMRIAAGIGLLGAVAVNNSYADFRRANKCHLGRFAINRFPMFAHVHDNLQYGTAIERLKQVVRGES